MLLQDSWIIVSSQGHLILLSNLICAGAVWQDMKKRLLLLYLAPRLAAQPQSVAVWVRVVDLSISLEERHGPTEVLCTRMSLVRNARLDTVDQSVSTSRFSYVCEYIVYVLSFLHAHQFVPHSPRPVSREFDFCQRATVFHKNWENKYVLIV